MMKTFLAAGLILGLGGAAAQAAPSTFQMTCSNIAFGYDGNDAALNATCLKSDGSPNATSVKILGISNQNGVLTNSGGASSFQNSCGNITINVDGPNVTIEAICRGTDGKPNETSIDLLGINNIDGTLSY